MNPFNKIFMRNCDGFLFSFTNVPGWQKNLQQRELKINPKLRHESEVIIRFSIETDNDLDIFLLVSVVKHCVLFPFERESLGPNLQSVFVLALTQESIPVQYMLNFQHVLKHFPKLRPL